MRITSKGQVTIPAHIREQAGLLPHTEVDFVMDDGGVRLVKTKSKRSRSRGKEIVRRMKLARTLGMSTDEIMGVTRGWGEDDPGFR